MLGRKSVNSGRPWGSDRKAERRKSLAADKTILEMGADNVILWMTKDDLWVLHLCAATLPSMAWMVTSVNSPLSLQSEATEAMTPSWPWKCTTAPPAADDDEDADDAIGDAGGDETSGMAGGRRPSRTLRS